MRNENEIREEAIRQAAALTQASRYYYPGSTTRYEMWRELYSLLWVLQDNDWTLVYLTEARFDDVTKRTHYTYDTVPFTDYRGTFWDVVAVFPALAEAEAYRAKLATETN